LCQGILSTPNYTAKVIRLQLQPTDAEQQQSLHAQELLLGDLQEDELLGQVLHPDAVLVHGGDVHAVPEGEKQTETDIERERERERGRVSQGRGGWNGKWNSIRDELQCVYCSHVFSDERLFGERVAGQR